MLHKNIPYRRWQDYLHKKRLAEIASRSYTGVRFKNERCYVSCRNSNVSQFLKQKSEKRIRQRKINCEEKALRGGEYKKLFEFWWELL